MSINYSLGGLVINDIICINLKKRKDRRVKLKRESRKKKFPVSFVRGVINKENPKLGKWMAHLKVWESITKNKKNKNVLILEDDAKILISRLLVPTPPAKWDMLYLGGNIQRVFTDDETDTSESWKRVCTLMTHAYILNYGSARELVKMGKIYLQECKKLGEEVLDLDKWLCTKYHLNKLVYTAIPDRIIQRDGYSDVKGDFATFNQQLTDRAFVVNEGDDVEYDEELDESKLTELRKTPMEIIKGEDSGGKESTGYVLKLPKMLTEDLPNVTLLTPVRNNKSSFYFAVRNFYKLNYPKEKLRGLSWMIVRRVRRLESWFRVVIVV